jgi:hypothetical protein
MFVAAALVALIVGGLGAVQLLNHNRPARPGGISLAEDVNAQLLKLGLGDHLFCAVENGFASQVFTSEQMEEQLGAEFSSLVAMAQEKAPENYKVVAGHRCGFGGRQFVHLILKGPQTALSLILTKKNGESFSRENGATFHDSPEGPIFGLRDKDFDVEGFETRDHLAFVVSNLVGNDNLQMAATLAPVLREFFTNREGQHHDQ